MQDLLPLPLPLPVERFPELPSFTVWAIRLVWVASQALCLLAFTGFPARAFRRHAAWFVYLCLSLTASFLYLIIPPELDSVRHVASCCPVSVSVVEWHWSVQFHILVDLVITARLFAILESSHWQTGDSVLWIRLAPTSWAAALCITSTFVLLWPSFGNISSYFQVWGSIGLLVSIGILQLLHRWIWNRYATTTMLVMAVMSANHATLRVIEMFNGGVWSAQAWKSAGILSTVIDTGCYIAWFVQSTAIGRSLNIHRHTSLRSEGQLQDPTASSTPAVRLSA